MNKEIARYFSTKVFNPQGYIKNKIVAINHFFKTENLDSCVVGLSGGIDSAVTLRLLEAAALEKDSPIKIIVGLILPIFGSGTSSQKEAIDYALSLKNESSDITFIKTIDLTKSYNEYLNDSHSHGVSTWAKGQLASIVRTPMLYFQAALLQERGHKSIVVGTTNLSEGGYIGFFGKASDGMTDLQLIADLYKSEVYDVAEFLDVPKEIIQRQPKGDVHDGKCDEELIGCSYDFLEYYMEEFLGNFKTNKKLVNIENGGIWKIIPKYWEWKKSIEDLHTKNAHKYKVGSPARFINLKHIDIPDGWCISKYLLK